MALKIALDGALSNIVSSGTNSNPIMTSHPTTGSTVEKQLFLYNDDNTKYYTGISIDPTDTQGTDESTWVYLAPDNAGVAGTYGAASAPLSMADIGAAGAPNTSGHAFWYKVVVPSGQTVQNKTDIKITVNFTEHAV